MTKYQCVVCEKDIPEVHGPFEKDWEGMWNGGIVDKIAAGYGSKIDGDMFVIAICDECVIEKNLKWVGNYMERGMTKFEIPKFAKTKITK